MWLAICWSYFGLWRRAGWPRLWRKMSSARYRLVESESCLVCVNWESTGHYRYCLSSCQLYVLVPLHTQVPCTPENCILCNLALLPRGPIWLHIFTSLGLFLAPIPRVAACGRGPGPALWSLVMFDAAVAFFCLCSTAGHEWSEARGQFLLSVAQSSN